MLKPHTQQKPVVQSPTTNVELDYGVESLNLYDLNKHFKETTTLKERTKDKKADNPSSNEQSSNRNLTQIYKKNNAYYVYMETGQVYANWGSNLTSFTTFLLSLSKDDKLYFYQTGWQGNVAFTAQILGTFQSATKARKILVIDHPIEDATFLSAYDEFIIADTGAVIFQTGFDIDNLDKWDKAFLPYAKALYKKAVDKKFISQEEFDLIFEKNAIIFKTAKQLREQGVVSTSF